jgi:hypothetical protein
MTRVLKSTVLGRRRVTLVVIWQGQCFPNTRIQDATDHGMKFFTLDWWRGLQQLEDYDPVLECKRHLSAIRERIPEGLLALQETVSLHDANLRSLDYASHDKSLRLQLDVAARQYVIRYTDVVSFRTIVDRERGLPGPRGFGDLGYDEADITADGDFEHRLLFSAGIEIQIVFRAFELKWKDAK